MKNESEDFTARFSASYRRLTPGSGRWRSVSIAVLVVLVCVIFAVARSCSKEKSAAPYWRAAAGNLYDK
jgi:hypothetical protein